MLLPGSTGRHCTAAMEPHQVHQQADGLHEEQQAGQQQELADADLPLRCDEAAAASKIHNGVQVLYRTLTAQGKVTGYRTELQFQ